MVEVTWFWKIVSVVSWLLWPVCEWEDSFWKTYDLHVVQQYFMVSQFCLTHQCPQQPHTTFSSHETQDYNGGWNIYVRDDQHVLGGFTTFSWLEKQNILKFCGCFCLSKRLLDIIIRFTTCFWGMNRPLRIRICYGCIHELHVGYCINVNISVHWH